MVYYIHMTIDYIHLTTVDSTNNWVKAHASDLKSMTCVMAEEQTAGRGRFSRQWLSPRGLNIYATLYFTLEGHPSYVANIGEIMAFSCTAILRNEQFPAHLKWPNDILIEKKKVGGVLTETVAFEKQLGVVVGIGLNVNMEANLLDQIDQPATSLAAYCGKKWDLQKLLSQIMDRFAQDLSLLQKRGFQPFQEQFNAWLAYKGEKIVCGAVQGICHGISSEGKLDLLLPSGEHRFLSSGEITTSSQKQ